LGEGGADDPEGARLADMNTLPTCPVCGHDVEPDGTHGEVEVTTEVQEERPEEYILHRRCAEAVFGGWSV
jgi:hypothetical protein